MSEKLIKAFKYILQVALIAFIYFYSAKFGLSLAGATKQVTLVWPPTGIALFALLVFGINKWPAVAIAAFAANITTGETFQIAAGITIGNTLEAVVGAYLLNSFGFDKFFSKAKDVILFVLLGVGFSTTISATIGVSSLIYGGIGSWSRFFPVWLTWWLGDAIGSIIAAPLLLTWYRWKKPSFNGARVAEALFIFSLLSLASLLLFTNYFTPVFSMHPFHFEYAITPFLIWIAFRFRHRGSTLAILLVSGIAIWGTVTGAGPFIVEESLEQSLFLLQSFMGILALTFLIFSSLVEERGKAEEKVELSERRFRALIENSSDAITLIDRGGKIIYSSPSNVKVLGYTPEEVFGRNAFELIHPEDRAYTQKLLAKLVAFPKESVVAEYRIRHKDGTYRYAEGIGTNLLDEPAVGAVVVNFRDITERKKLDEIRSEFVSLAAHQLRAPVSTIRWYTETLLGKKKVTTGERESLITEIHKAILRMNSLINLLLNISRVELGTLKIEPVKFDAKKLVREVLTEKELQESVTQRKIKLKEEYKGALTLFADQKLVQLIFDNLISNAVKYSKEKGVVEILLKREKDGVLFSVKDYGAGIPKSQHEKMFTKLFRADNVKKEFPEGMGLGLYLVKSIVDNMGASIWFESEEGKGSNFFVKFVNVKS